MTRSARGLAAQASRALLWNVALIPLQAVVALVASALVARRLAVEHYALYGLALATLTSLLLWSDLGLMPMVSRYTPVLRASGGTVLRRFLGQVTAVRLAALAAAALGFAAAWHLGALRHMLPFEGPGLALLLAALAAQGVARLHEYFLSGLLERRTVGLVRLVVGLAHPLLVIAAVTAGYGVNGILAAVCAASLLDVALFAWAAVRRTRAAPPAENPPPALPSDLRAQAARFAAVSYVEKLASHLNSTGFIIFLVAALGTRADVAVFAVAGEFASRVIAVISIPFSGLTLPLFASVEAERPEETGTAARLYLVVMLLACIPAAALFSALAGPLVTLVYSDRYLEAAPILRAFVPFLFVEYAIYSALLAPLLTRGRYRAILLSKLPMAGGLLAVVLVLPGWGTVGAALAYGLARLASAAVLLSVGQKELGFRFPLAFAGKVLLASAVATGAATLVQPVAAGWVSLPLAGLAAGAAFLAVYRLLGGMDEQDRVRVAQGAQGAPAFERLVTYLL
ncbi:MAG TPA: oligosaccharide flippase family protein [Vicinamibacteria bacterium]|nr:oligosaccharide flippase family protein [Vicinamibacteria bacterium]